LTRIKIKSRETQLRLRLYFEKNCCDCTALCEVFQLIRVIREIRGKFFPVFVKFSTAFHEFHKLPTENFLAALARL